MVTKEDNGKVVRIVSTNCGEVYYNLTGILRYEEYESRVVLDSESVKKVIFFNDFYGMSYIKDPYIYNNVVEVLHKVLHKVLNNE